jgi:uncharacterized protein (DUF427 family)
MVRAVWRGAVIAESEDTLVVEGNHYFPRDSVKDEYLVPSSHHSECGWKGTAHYSSLDVDGERNQDAAWYYPLTTPEAGKIRGRVAFWRGVTVGD